jgi:hypothetical protein
MDRHSFLVVSKEIAADKRISATEKLLLAQLLDHRNKRTGQCNPKQERLAQELGIGLATVKRGLSALRKLGFIAIKRTQTCCNYEIQIAQNERSDSSKVGGQIAQNELLDAPYPLYEPYIKEPGASRTPQKSIPRKSVQSEVLESYYREERRKAGR